MSDESLPPVANLIAMAKLRDYAGAVAADDGERARELVPDVPAFLRLLKEASPADYDEIVRVVQDLDDEIVQVVRDIEASG